MTPPPNGPAILQATRPIMTTILLAAHELHPLTLAPEWGRMAQDLLQLASCRLSADESTRVEAMRCHALARCVDAGIGYATTVNRFLALAGHGPEAVTDHDGVHRVVDGLLGEAQRRDSGLVTTA